MTLCFWTGRKIDKGSSVFSLLKSWVSLNNLVYSTPHKTVSLYMFVSRKDTKPIIT